MSIIQTIIMVVIYLQQSEVAGQTDQCKNTLSNNTSPINISNSSHSCSYNEIMEIQFSDKLTNIKSSYDQGVLKFSGFPQTGYRLYAEDATKSKLHYQLSYMQIVSPNQHQLQNYTDDGSRIELQVFFDQIFTSNQSINTNAPQAAISVLFTNNTSQYYMPDGNAILDPLYSYGQFTSPNNQSSVDANLNQVFSELIMYYHQWYTYLGNTINDHCNQKVNWYVNSQIFLINNQILNRYSNLNQNDTGLSMNGPTILQDTKTNILMICYSGLEETVLRQDYAVWLWVLGIFVWWIIEVITENDTKECFMDEFNNNRWTQMPLYSLYWVNNDIFFTKLSRFTLMLVVFSWEVTIMSILYAQFYLNGKYQVTDGYIIWYALVALMLGWPVGYFFGAQLYHIRETWKEKTFLQTEWKKVIDKTSLEALELQKGIELEQNRQYTSWFFFYLGLFFLMIMDFCVSIWQNTFLSKQVQNYWVASIFLMVFMDMAIFDVIVAFVPGPQWTKYRAFYYDFELGTAYRRLEETT